MSNLRFNRILVVCVGNICRSPTAELLFRHRLAGAGVSVCSAGLSALEGHGIDPAAAARLRDECVDPGPHRARQLTPELLIESDLVLAMEHGHIKAIVHMVPHVRGKVFLLGKWANNREVPDPYRQSDEMFAHVHALISSSVDDWIEKIGVRT